MKKKTNLQNIGVIPIIGIILICAAAFCGCVSADDDTTYTVTFDGNGSTSGTMDTQTFTHDVEQKLTANTFTKTGYTFEEWNTQNDGKGETYTDEQPITITENVNLYAVWTEQTTSSSSGGDSSSAGNDYYYNDDDDDDSSSSSTTTTPTVTPTPTVKPTPEPKTVVIVETEVKFEDNKVIKSITVPEGSSGSITFTQTEEESIDEWIPESIDDVYRFDLSCDREITGDITVNFVINDYVLEKLELKPNDVGLRHRENEVWNELETTFTEKDGIYYYSAVTQSLSPFEIFFKEGAAKPVEVKPVTPTEETPTKSPMPLLGLLAGLGAAALVLRRK